MDFLISSNIFYSFKFGMAKPHGFRPVVIPIGRGEWASSWAVPRWAQVVFGPNEQTRHENTVTMLQVFHRPHLTGIRKASS